MDTSPASVAVDDDGTIVVNGEFDAFTAPDLAEALERLDGDSSATVVVEMSGVTFIDSSTLQVLIEQHRRLDEGGGRLVISSPSAAVTRLFDIAGLNEHFNIEATPATD